MILISGAGCGICKTAKKLLEKKNIEFEEIDYSNEKSAEYIEKAKQYNALPFLFDGEECYSGMDAVKYIKQI